MGVDIPNEKRIEISLQYIYGVGQFRARQILKETGINPDTRARDLKDDEVARIAAFIDKNYNDEVVKDGRSGPVEGALRRKVQQAILRLKKIGSFRGTRHIKGLPVRGQRTRTNARTRKGKKKTVAVKRSVKEMR
jgi:small subunit ribosomal protein S13